MSGPSSPKDDMKTAIDEQIDSKVPGLAIVAVDADGVLFCEGFGRADLSTDQGMSTVTVCNWFSMTKLVTATAVMQLVDEGLLDLDAPVGSYYKPFEMTRPAARAATATVRHLLCHSSGLANPLPLRWVHPATEAGPIRGEFVRRLIERHRRLRFDPGTQAAYSNLGYLVLGEIIEAVSGETFEEFIQRRILDPLGMKHTGFLADPSSDWATPYQRRRSPLGVLLPVLLPRKIIGPTSGPYRSLRHFYVDGAPYGGLVGPAADAARFLQAHIGDGTLNGTRILSAESARTMRHIIASGRNLQVGLGWFRRGRHPDDRFVEHLGGGAGFWNCMRSYPDQAFGVVIMGNATTYDHHPIAEALLREFR